MIGERVSPSIFLRLGGTTGRGNRGWGFARRGRRAVRATEHDPAPPTRGGALPESASWVTRIAPESRLPGSGSTSVRSTPATRERGGRDPIRHLLSSLVQTSASAPAGSATAAHFDSRSTERDTT